MSARPRYAYRLTPAPTTARDDAPHPSCADADPDLWFSDSPRDIDDAKTVCADCPALQLCAKVCLAEPPQHGVWAGKRWHLGKVIG